MGFRNGSILAPILVASAVVAFASLPLEAAWAPINPSFVESLQEEAFKAAETSELRGRTPSPVDLSHLAGRRFFGAETFERAAALPASYDLRALGCVTPVRDQAPYGSCWTFSALASLESSALRAGLKAPDYAEMHLGYFGYIDQSPSLPGFDNVTSEDVELQDLMDFGGNDFQAVALLARGTGAVNETDAPYGKPPRLDISLSRRLERVCNFYRDPDAFYPEADIENIKGTLMAYGAVSVGVYAGDPLTGDWSRSPYFNAETSASFTPAGNSDGLGVGRANHAVTIVGWDDGYPRENFNSLNRPEKGGAWIVRNSWGTRWGDGGYFYLSYEDAVLDTGAAYVGGPADIGVRIYQHDPLGWISSYSPSGEGKETAWLANRFTAVETGKIEAVSFYAGGVGNAAEIHVYTGGDGAPRSGTLVIDGQKALPDVPGYHRVTLDKPVYIPAGEAFSVVVRLTTPGYPFPVAVEKAIVGYSDKAAAGRGESFVSANGITWTDLTDIEATANVCLKAFARSLSSPVVSTDIVASEDLAARTDFNFAVLASAFDEEALLDLLGASSGRLEISSADLISAVSWTLAGESAEIGLDEEEFASPSGTIRKAALLAFNHRRGLYEPLETPEPQAASVTVRDGGPYDGDGAIDGTLTDLRLLRLAARVELPSPDSGGGCALGFAPAALLLVIPAFLFRVKR